MRYIPTLFLMLILSSVLLFSQEKPPADSKGKEFWFAFPPNYHNSKNDPDDKLYIFIAADVPTTCTLDYTNRFGGTSQKTFQIIDVNKIEILEFFHKDLELIGWNDSKDILGNTDVKNDNEKISPASFHLTSDEEISVYIQNQAVTTSDATLVYPIDAIGKNYYVMSYKAGLRFNLVDVTPSQFVIVATEDNTSVEITPPAGNPTQVHGDQPFTINMNKGNSYLVQSAKSTDVAYDLTGTRIVASAPVTVIGGHQRAQIPLENTNNPSRDYLLQQLIPVESWHKSAFVVPFETVEDGIRNKDLVRVLSASDNNRITLNGQFLKNLDRAEFLELNVDSAIHLSSSAPMQVATYAKTTQTNGTGGKSNTGDPLMMLIHPKEQFYNEYKFINTQTKEDGSNLYTDQYVAVILPSKGKSSLKFDGVAVPQTGYLPIPNSDYEYKVLKSSDGVHTITCDEDIAIYIYGYAPANSYGYIGGMNFRIFDHKDPVITEKKDCFNADVVVTDTLPYDSGIEYFNIDNNTNLDLTIDKSNAPQIISFKAAVLDRFADASISYTVRDSMGFGYSKKIDLPGFTVAYESKLNATDIYENNHKNSKLKLTHCFDLILQNYGKFKQTISDINFKTLGKAYGLENIQLPLNLQPGETKKFQLCFSSDTPLVIKDTIYITGDCLDRNVAGVSYQFLADSEKPKVTTQTGDCNKYIDIVATDSTEFDLGIDQVIFDSLNNIEKQQENKAAKYSVRLMVLDTKKPAFYALRIIDAYGNVTSVTDTLYPMSLRLVADIDSSPDKTEQYFGEFKVGYIGKDSVYLENYGEYPQTIIDAYAVINRHFSVPKGQFPLVIPPFTEKGIEVIYHPDLVRAERYRDTIIIEADCFSDYLPVAADAAPIEFDALTKCDVPLKLTSNGVPYELYIGKPSPMPSAEFITISYTSNFSDKVDYSIYSNTGSKQSSGSIEMPEGQNSVSIPISELPNGQYMITLTSDNINQNFVIIKQR